MSNSKLDITKAFIADVEQKGLAGVRITELVDELGLNRKTFYYHFDSKYELAMRIFLMDLGKSLRENFGGRNIVFVDVVAGKKQEEPYAAYVRIEEAAHAYDTSGFLKAAAQAVLSRRRFYEKLFSEKEIGFLQVFEEVYRPIVNQDIRRARGGRFLPQQAIDLLVEIGLSTYVTQIRFMCRDDAARSMLDETTNPFWNFYQEALVTGIREHPLARKR